MVLSRNFGYFREPQRFFCEQVVNSGHEGRELTKIYSEMIIRETHLKGYSDGLYLKKTGK